MVCRTCVKDNGVTVWTDDNKMERRKVRRTDGLRLTREDGEPVSQFDFQRCRRRDAVDLGPDLDVGPGDWPLTQFLNWPALLRHAQMDQ